jgi:MFS family permease
MHVANAQMMVQRPPALPLLQGLSFLISFGCFLIVMINNAYWTDLNWSPWAIGLGMTLANCSYASLVHQGGRMAERFGRVRTAILGAAICALGALLPLVALSPWSSLAGSMLAFGGTGFYFPAVAGLFSDAAGISGRPAVPLHRKVSQYNFGWSAGCLLGFLASGLVEKLPIAVGYAIGLGAFLLIVVILLRWQSLSTLPPQSAGDRADHPALKHLTLMHRCGLLIAASVAMSVVSLLTRALSASGEARHLTSLTLTAYASCYVITFYVLGRWSGWVLKPWRLWWFQLSLIAGSGGLLALPYWSPEPNLTALCLFGGLIGVGFATAYTPSIYYSLRIPNGAARAAGLHETFIGIGNTVGPILAGIFIEAALRVGDRALPILTALGGFGLIVAIIGIVFQAIMIPKAVRLGAS